MTTIIIGGGIAGLTAGIYAQKNGFESLILEQHAITGGECTGWNRKGYHIDGCIDWMTGTNPGNALNDLWKETGALDGVEIIKLEYQSIYERRGVSLTMWRDITRYQADMTSISPEDKPLIDEFFTAVGAMRNMQVPVKKPFDLMNPFELTSLGFSMIKVGGVMAKYGKISVREFADRFKSEFLREYFCDRLRPEIQMSSLLFMTAAFCYGVADIPRGGSLEMAQRMEKRYTSLGGQVRTKTRVRKIIVEGNRASGLELENGETIRADHVIAACDIHVTKALLENRYPFPEFDRCDANPDDYMPISCVHIALGITDTCEGIPARLIFDCEPYTAGVTRMRMAGYKTYSYQKFAPEGCTLAVAYIDQKNADCDYWLNLYGDKEAYKAAKAKLAEEVISRIEKRFPKLAGKIEVLDVATPATYNRYVGAFKGSYMAYMFTPQAKPVTPAPKVTGIGNLYLSGQWLQFPGGLPSAVAQGKFAVQRLCRDLKKKFVGVQ